MSQTVERATQLIEFVASGSHTLREISEHFEQHRSTVFRQLQTLSRAGFLIQRDDGTWGIGMRFVSIAEQALDGLDLRRIARNTMRELHNDVGNTIHLAQLIGDDVVYVDKIEDLDGVRMSSRIGNSVVPQHTGVGKAVLARLDGQRRDAVLASAVANGAPVLSAADRSELDAALELIRATGWTVDAGENEDFVNCVAAPITNSTGKIVGAMSISAIAAVHDLAELTAHVDTLLAASKNISRQLG